MMKLLRWYKKTEDSTPELQYDNGSGAFVSYSSHPHYGVVREYNEPNGSKGYRMMHYLLKQGYKFVNQNGDLIE